MRGLMADPSGRIIDVPVRSNFREGMTRPRVLHLDPRRPQGPRRHRPPDGRLGLPDPAPGRRRPGRHHPRGGLRHGGGQLDHPRRVERDRSRGGVPAAARRPAGRPRRCPTRSSRSTRAGRASSSTATRRSTRRSPRAIDAAGIDEVLVRSPLTCEARHGVCRMCYGRNLATGELVGIGRGGRHHRRPVDRRAGHAADDADVPHRRRRRRWTSPPACRASRSCSRPAIPKGKAEISHIDGIVEIIRSETGTKVKVTSREAVRHAGPAAGRRRAARRTGRPRRDRPGRWRASTARRPADVTVAGQGVPRPRRRRPRSSAPRTSSSASTRSRTTRKLLVENGQEIRAGDAITDGPINPQEYLDTRGGRRPALPGQGGPEGLPEPGRHDQRQAHRDHRPPDAAQGPHRPAGRHRAAARPS